MQRTSVLRRIALIIFCHISFPFTSAIFRTWCTSIYPPTLPQYSHRLALSRLMSSVLLMVSHSVRVVTSTLTLMKLAGLWSASRNYLNVLGFPFTVRIRAYPPACWRSFLATCAVVLLCLCARVAKQLLVARLTSLSIAVL